MSKTDKTNPIWVGREWEPLHRLACREYVPRPRWRRVSRYEPCNLPDEPPARYERWSWRKGRDACIWEPILPSAYHGEGAREWKRPRAVRENANKIERRIRTEWRDHRRKLLSSRICAENIPGCCCLHDLLNEDDLVPPDPRHRNYALWDMW